MRPGRILVVDNDAMLLSMIEEALGRAGFACACARSDAEAHALLQADGGFDALVVDINLGLGVTGFDIAREARRSLPLIRVVYMSGDTNLRSWTAYGVPMSDYLSKPFALEKLIALVNHGLGQGDATAPAD